MTTLKVTEAKCFEQVSKVIGAKNAERELFIATQHKNCKFDPSDDIWGAFVWYNTKQGNDFWYSISQGINPYEQ
jgi:frataxin-like iron-binding protein CyaY